MCSNVAVIVSYNKELTAYLKLFGFFKLKIYPPKPKKLSLKKQKTNAKGQANKKKKKKTADISEKGGANKDLRSLISELYELVLSIIKRMSYKLRIRVKELDVTVAGEDPAKTALLYSAVCNSLSVFADMISGFEKIKCRIDKLHCGCDFTATEFVFKADIVISIRVYRAVGAAIGILIDYLKRTNITED